MSGGMDSIDLSALRVITEPSSGGRGRVVGCEDMVDCDPMLAGHVSGDLVLSHSPHLLIEL